MKKVTKDTLELVQAVEDALEVEGILIQEDKDFFNDLKSKVTDDKTDEELDAIGAEAMKRGDHRVIVNK